MNLFNSVILLFVVHPFDVGDALLITTTTSGTGAADYCVVEELSLVVTIPVSHDLLSIHLKQLHHPVCLPIPVPSRMHLSEVDLRLAV